jgi:hypothetical protein
MPVSVGCVNRIVVPPELLPELPPELLPPELLPPELLPPELLPPELLPDDPLLELLPLLLPEEPLLELPPELLPDDPLLELPPELLPEPLPDDPLLELPPELLPEEPLLEVLPELLPELLDVPDVVSTDVSAVEPAPLEPPHPARVAMRVNRATLWPRITQLLSVCIKKIASVPPLKSRSARARRMRFCVHALRRPFLKSRGQLMLEGARRQNVCG